MQRQTLEETFDATFLQGGIGEIGEMLDDILSGEESKRSKKKGKKEKKVELSDLIATIPFEPSTLPLSITLFANKSDPFQQWLYKQREKDRVVARDKFIARECERLEALRNKEKKEWSQQTYELWKFKKDLESRNAKRLHRDIGKMLETVKSKPKKTETLPGYISTWSCDTQLAKKMQKVCPRGTRSV